MPLRHVLRLLGLASIFLVTSTAAADGFGAVPALEGSANDLQIRWVRYNGGTNGAMLVEVKNAGTKRATFVADGLYFVPQGDPEKAPQRLGASGPLQIVDGNKTQTHVESLTLRPGETRQVSLDVFCIDSHRSSPNSGTQFKIADKRMPKKLRAELKSSNQAIYRKHKGAAAPAAKSEVQSNMWKVRDKDWVKLEGERKQEKRSGSGLQRHQNVAPQQQRRRR